MDVLISAAITHSYAKCHEKRFRGDAGPAAGVTPSFWGSSEETAFELSCDGEEELKVWGGVGAQPVRHSRQRTWFIPKPPGGRGPGLSEEPRQGQHDVCNRGRRRISGMEMARLMRQAGAGPLGLGTWSSS